VLLVERARRGDAAAFEALVRRYYRAAHAVALAVLGNPMDAEDACQDAFLRALERLDRLRQPERFSAWLLQIVRNRARNFRSYRRVRSVLPLEEVRAASDEDTGREAEREELRRELKSALTELSEIQREVVLLHDLEGWKHREIGELLGLSEGMSRQHLMSARRLLRERLGTKLLKEYSDD
jgi:RNA polymerase sigma-70 factor (ECF subfamily)